MLSTFGLKNSVFLIEERGQVFKADPPSSRLDKNNSEIIQ